MKAELVTKIKGRTFNRYFPCWKVTVDDKVVHVDQKGEIYSKELPGYNDNLPYRQKGAKKRKMKK